MAPKKSVAKPPPTVVSSDPSTGTATLAPTASSSVTSKDGSSSLRASASSTAPQDILLNLWGKYVDTTPQRVKLIDTFMAFLVVVGVVQFVYAVVGGNYVSGDFLNTQLEEPALWVL
jgi:oligosaccharyltransferase complex subunit epsilon